MEGNGKNRRTTREIVLAALLACIAGPPHTTDGKEGLETALKEKPNLVILDITLIQEISDIGYRFELP